MSDKRNMLLKINDGVTMVHSKRIDYFQPLSINHRENHILFDEFEEFI